MEIDREGLASLLANIAEVILTVDSSGTIIFCSPTIRDVYGWAPEQLVGHSFVEFTHPDQAVELFEAFGAVVGQDLQLGDDFYTWMLRASDGTYVATDISIAVGAELAPLGGIAATLQPQNQREPLRNEVIRLVDNENRLARLASILLSSEVADFEKALDIAAEELTHLVLVGRTSIWRVDGDRLERRVVAQRDTKLTTELPEYLPLASLREFAGGRLLEAREALVSSSDIPASWAMGSAPWFIDGVDNGLAEAMMVDGRFLGFVLIENTYGLGHFDSTHFSAMRSAAAILGGALGRHDAELELQWRATTDILTSLPNRWAAVELLDEWLQSSEPDPLGLGIALLDLDRFKVVNESLGHAAGDRMLLAVAVRLSTAIDGTGGMLARLGGDEFIAIWRSVADIDAALALARRLTTALAPPLTLDGSLVPVTASVGVMHVPPGGCATAEALRRAEEAMYRAKSKGGNLVETDDEHHYSRLTEQVREETELRAAVAGGELEAWFQGEWDLLTGRLTGAEALVRWHHPRLGFLSASDFVNLAEEMGIISSIGNMMLRASFAALAEWRELIAGEPFVLRVNISAKQLRDASLLETLATLQAEYAVDPASVCLELTESSLLGDPEAAAAMLARIRALDIGLAIDDFGTGYSSLMYLKRLPLTGLKIDQAFVAGLPDDPIDAAVVGAVVALAGRLGVTVTAEGLETEAQRASVVDLGGRLGQGFLLSRPETGTQFRERLVAGAHLVGGIAPGVVGPEVAGAAAQP